MPDRIQTEFALRRERLTELLNEARCPALLVTALPNVQYLTGFTGSNGAVLFAGDRFLLFTDPRYTTQASQQSHCDVKIAKGPLIAEVARWVKRLRIKLLGFEANRIGFAEQQSLKSLLPGSKLKPLTDAVEIIRSVKSEAARPFDSTRSRSSRRSRISNLP